MSSLTEAHPHRTASADWFIDLCSVLFLIASAIGGSISAHQSVQEYWLQKAAFEAFKERPPMLVPNEPQSVLVDYQHTDPSQLIAEAAGGVFVLALTCLFRHRLGVSLSAERQLPKIASRNVRVIDLKPSAHRNEPRRSKSGNVAAQRLADVLWADRSARQEAQSPRGEASGKVA
jgi:hypothetical protein